MRAPVFPAVAPGAGHYESYFVKGHHPSEGRAFWLRHTIHQRPGEAPTASLWLTLFDAASDTPVVAGKQTVRHPSVPAGGYVAIADAELSPGRGRGRLQSPTLDADWDFTIHGDEPEQRHLPADWMYTGALPRTKSGTPHPGVTFQGTMAGIDLDGWHGLVSHNWGSQHAERWIWLHAALPGQGWIELVLGRIRLGPVTTPWLANGALQLGGERLRLGGLGRTRATRVDERATGVRLIVTGAGGVRVELAIDAPPERFVVWRYADPDGPEHHSAHTSIGDLRAQVRRPGRPAVVLDEAMTASYELGMRETDHGLTVQPYDDGRI